MIKPSSPHKQLEKSCKAPNVSIESRPIPSGLKPALAKVEAAQKAEDLWQSARNLLRLALPFEFCCLNYYPFLATAPMLFRERYPFASIQEFQRFCQVAPFTPYLQANPGVRYARLSDIIEEPELLSSCYYREFMRPSRSRYETCLFFWDGTLFEGLVGLHRASRHGDFSDAEISLLLQFYSDFHNALRRVLQVHREKAMRSSLELLLDQLPLATIVLDWNLRVTYQNRAAEEMEILWNLGPLAARSLKSKRSFNLPLEILQSCHTLKNIGYHCDTHPLQLSNANKLVVLHQSLPGLRATVNLLQMEAAPLSLPMFLVRLENRENCLGESQDDRTADRLVLFSSLSWSEQRVASLASRGFRNSEIAERLNKSILTVKKQLQSVYRKLDVPGRSRLIALLAASRSLEEKIDSSPSAGEKNI
jgi:DNA-binding CsgD family transcriptional regulator/PAS domain-containing protein